MVRPAITSPPSTAIPVPTVALTTTFAPPAECAENHLTMLVGALEKIWINEPAPLPNTTISSCYPTEWVDGYSSVMSKSSSVAPFMSPLVCPSGWNSESSTWANGYVVCCASGFTFAAPTRTVDKDRPGYGGTCYSNFDISQTATVTVYNPESLSTTIQWSPTTTPAQAYAHPIDGIAADYTPGTAAAEVSGTGSAGTPNSNDNSAPRSGSGGNSKAALAIGFLLASLMAW
ncbi:CFEM domain protein [Colletotrichum musicola]|uniref:CFEM domain protein n=3 Tax=Colletotrichum orchidearum species complex TaxID=2707337 RepID=A0A8H6J744_9PEZI|nr:CFEM domain protein [Colletotrichum sojae]KAF6807744.1 CFEM domain protein [Colletotrichum musicola]KAF6833505.1 CFEM domain protein [Colletotrichum plurivorum]